MSCWGMTLRVDHLAIGVRWIRAWGSPPLSEQAQSRSSAPAVCGCRKQNAADALGPAALLLIFVHDTNYIIYRFTCHRQNIIQCTDIS